MWGKKGKNEKQLRVLTLLFCQLSEYFMLDHSSFLLCSFLSFIQDIKAGPTSVPAPFWAVLWGASNEARLWEPETPWTREVQRGIFQQWLHFVNLFKWKRQLISCFFMKKIDYPLKWARTTEAASDLRCSMEIKGDKGPEGNCPEFLSVWPRWHSHSSGRSPDSALGGSAGSVARVFRGWVG